LAHDPLPLVIHDALVKIARTLTYIIEQVYLQLRELFTIIETMSLISIFNVAVLASAALGAPTTQGGFTVKQVNYLRTKASGIRLI
jgi:hypothetical protein